MSRINEKHRPLFILGALLTLVMACMFLPSILNHVPLAYGTDLKPEQQFFTQELYNLLDNFFKTGNLPFYSWKMFLGNNFYASMSFYGNGDIYNLLGYLIKGVNFFDRTLILEIIKFYVAGFSFYWLLTKFQLKPIIRVFGALVYAFSGWAVFFSGQLMFLSVYSFIPVYFVGMENYLQKQKWGLFTLSIPLLIFTNWYFFYSVSLLSPVYYLYRYYCLHHSFKNVLKPTTILIGFYVLGVLLSAFYFLPTLFYMTGNDRAFHLVDYFAFENWKVYLHLLVSSFVPNNLYIYRTNIFNITENHYTREICMYAGVLVAALLPHAFFLKDKFYTKATRILFLLLAVILVLPIGDAAMHGFAEPSFRWLCIYLIFAIVTACIVLEHRKELDKKRAYRIIGIEMVLCIGIIPLCILLSHESFQVYFSQWIYFILSGLLLPLYGRLLFKETPRRNQYLLALTALELCCFQGAFFLQEVKLDDAHSYAFSYRATHVLQDNPNELNTYLNQLDPENPYEYYRVYLDQSSICWDYSHNMPIAYELNGLMTYESTYEPSFNGIKALVPEVRDFDSEFLFNIKDYNLLSFLSTKYAIVTSEDQLPKGRWRLVDDHYRVSLLVYENEDYRPVGNTYSSALLVEDYQDSSDFLEKVLVVEKDYAAVSRLLSPVSVSLENIVYGSNRFYGSYSSDQDGFMVLSIPYNSGWKVTLDGSEIPYYDVNGGFIGFGILQGDHEIQLYFVPPGFKVGCVISAAGFALFLFLTVWKKKQQRN